MLWTCGHKTFVYEFYTLKTTIILHQTYTAGADPGGGGTPPLKLEKIKKFGVKSWFFTQNTPKMFASPSTQSNSFNCTPLTWNPGSAPVQIWSMRMNLLLEHFMTARLVALFIKHHMLVSCNYPWISSQVMSNQRP